MVENQEDENSKEDLISIDKSNIKKTVEFFKNPKVQITLAVILFLVILFSSVSIRLSGLPNLIDQTTGHYVFADPDAFYEYRVAETIVNQGDISGIDTMRDPGLNITYTQEMLPRVLAFSYKIFHSINSKITLDYIDVLYPIVAFALSLILFFILCWYVSKSKLLALLASLMLAYSPIYFQRTGVGISSHEALGMIFFFLALSAYAISINNYKKNWTSNILLGIATGISLALALFSWGGGANFVLIIFSIPLLLQYLFVIKDKEKELKKKFIVFNLVWIFSSVVAMPLFGYPFNSMPSRFLSNYGLLVPFSIVFMILDFVLESYSHKIKLGQSKYRMLYSLFGTIIAGFFGLLVLGKNPFSLIYNVYYQILYPLGQGRVGLTVAYYAQPYLSDLINAISKTIFWIFFLGLIFIGIEFGKNIESKKRKNWFYIVWIVALFGILFSRYSSSSAIFDGAGFISTSIYLLSFLVLGFYLVFLYVKEKNLLNENIIFLFSWMIVMLMAVRSAVRVIFVIVTFVFFSVAFFVIKSYNYGKKSKGELSKYLFYILFILSLLVVFVFVFGNPFTNTAGAYQTISNTAKYSGPITNGQWQNAMAWVRNNTSNNSIFVHWWDYGYLVQTLGNRTTVVDGGNANPYWNHLVGRYLLTTPNPETALSFMKSHNVSYLLIDPTDIGKYPAYSKIGSNDNWDRLSMIQVMVSDSSQTLETANSTTRVYQGVTGVDDDIIYNDNNGTQVFLPGPTYDSIGSPNYKSYAIGAIMETSKYDLGLGLKQPEVIFAYSNKQTRIPIRYAYLNGQIFDFNSGINATLFLMPSISQNSQGVQIDPFGAAIYLSNKTMNSFFAQVYLMNDPFNRYPTIKLANIQSDPVVESLKSQNANIGEFLFYQGIRAPLKIWKADYPDNIIAREEFLRPSGGYGEFDNLAFVK